MISKFLWYFSSIAVIFLILITPPSKNNTRSSVKQNEILNVSPSQLSIKKLTSITVILFLVLSIILLMKV